jgi:hypothetical protein
VEGIVEALFIISADIPELETWCILDARRYQNAVFLKAQKPKQVQC